MGRSKLLKTRRGQTAQRLLDIFHGKVKLNGLLLVLPTVQTIEMVPGWMSAGKTKLTWLAPSTRPGAMPAYNTCVGSPFTAMVDDNAQSSSGSFVTEPQPVAYSVTTPPSETTAAKIPGADGATCS